MRNFCHSSKDNHCITEKCRKKSHHHHEEVIARSTHPNEHGFRNFDLRVEPRSYTFYTTICHWRQTDTISEETLRQRLNQIVKESHPLPDVVTAVRFEMLRRKDLAQGDLRIQLYIDISEVKETITLTNGIILLYSDNTSCGTTNIGATSPFLFFFC